MGMRMNIDMNTLFYMKHDLVYNMLKELINYGNNY